MRLWRPGFQLTNIRNNGFRLQAMSSSTHPSDTTIVSRQTSDKESSVTPNKPADSLTGVRGSTTESISKAMASYLERAKAHQIFMNEREEEFVFGRRHLANMMGKDPETFTQNDIDEAIRYLFPSGLFVPTSRPKMKPPNEIYPKAKAAQFDASGRPHHPFFYTTKPNFYFVIYEAVSKYNALNLHPFISDTTTSFKGSIWISMEELEKKLMERLTDSLYTEWVNCMDRLLEHPSSEREKEFISAYRKPIEGQILKGVLPTVTLEPDGRQSVTVNLCQKKTAVANVTVRMPGSGKIDINGKGLDYFPTMRAREAIIYPLQLVDWLGTVDIVSKVEGSGVMAQAATVRFGIATGIAALGADAERLRLAGLLTGDRRSKEKRHMGCEGARARWTWKKR